MSTLYVVRHAQASMFAANYDQLSELGRSQAARLGEVWAERSSAGFDAVFSGPAQRQRDTMALVGERFTAAGLGYPTARTLAEFDEHDGIGLVTNMLARIAAGEPESDPAVLEFAAKAIDASLDRRERSRVWQQLYEVAMRRWLAGEIEHDGVESWPTFHARVRAAFTEIRATTRGEVVVFTSVGPTAVILLEVLGLTPQRAFEQAWRLYNTGITRVIYSRDRATLDGYNDVSHLSREHWTHR